MSIRDAEEDVIKILKSGRLTSAFGMGPYLLKLEKEWARSTNCKYCVVFGGGTPALLKHVIKLNGFDWIERRIKFFGFLCKTTMWAVFTDDEEAYNYVRRLRVHGYDFEEEYKHDFLGLGARPSEMQAAIGIKLLGKK